MTTLDPLTTLPRYARIDPLIATAGQPSEAELQRVAQAGYDCVINLGFHDDPRYSLPDEAGTVRALGMDYIHIPVPFAAPDLSQLQAFSEAMRQHATQPVFIHCFHNKRVPVFVALYRIRCLGWDPAQALTQMRQVWVPDEVWQRFIEEVLTACGAAGGS